MTVLPEPELDLAELTRCERCTPERMCDVHMWLRIRAWTFDPLTDEPIPADPRKGRVLLRFE